MKLLKRSILGFAFFFVVPLVVFAHESEVPHEESIPTISPMFLVWIVGGLAISGFLLWKFVLHSPKSSSGTKSDDLNKTPLPAQEKTVSQSGESKSS